MTIIEKRIKLLFFVFILSYSQQILSQQRNVSSKDKAITLNDILLIAGRKSLDAFKAKQEFGASYWQFRSFRASLLPKVDLDFEPLTYNKSVSKRYDSENNIDVYRPQENLNSFADIAINQNVKATGATVYINSSFNRLSNFGDISSINYSVTPVRIGLIQPIMAFNQFKWEDKIAPIEFERSKKDYIFKLQEINLIALDYFFSWALASKKAELANENLLNAEKLFTIGSKRYNLGSIEKDDLLNLELDQYNAQISLTQSQKELEKAQSELRLFLRDELPVNAFPELPELISDLQIDAQEASLQAEANNPEIFNLKIKELETKRDLDKVIKDNRFDLSLIASYGLNQYAPTVKEAYNDLLEQQMISIKLNIPLLDWGERKGNIRTAKMNKEVNEIAIQQETDKLRQDLVLKVIDFNLQKKLVLGSLRSSEISKSSYEITEKRFLSGSVDLLRLTSARKAWMEAYESYILSLSNYWRFYYQVQKLTLYDFSNKSTLSRNLDELIDK